MTNNKNNVKKGKNYKLTRQRVLAGVIVIGLTFSVGVKVGSLYQKAVDLNNACNTCVQYEIQEGDTYEKLEETYGLKDIGFSHLEIAGVRRQEASKGHIAFLAVGDVVIGRTTREKAERLVEEGKAKIISIDEAVELLGNEKMGEFKKYADGETDFVFYVPTSKTL